MNLKNVLWHPMGDKAARFVYVLRQFCYGFNRLMIQLLICLILSFGFCMPCKWKCMHYNFYARIMTCVLFLGWMMRQNILISMVYFGQMLRHLYMTVWISQHSSFLSYEVKREDLVVLIKLCSGTWYLNHTFPSILAQDLALKCVGAGLLLDQNVETCLINLYCFQCCIREFRLLNVGTAIVIV